MCCFIMHLPVEKDEARGLTTTSAFQGLRGGPGLPSIQSDIVPERVRGAKSADSQESKRQDGIDATIPICLGAHTPREEKRKV